MFNLEELILAVGYFGLFGIVFAESGLFFGFFLPGDSLILTAGLLAQLNYLNILILIPLLVMAAVLGDSTGYWFGQKAGKKIFNRPNSLLFRQENLLKAKEFYDKHGGMTIVLARFMPFIRTFAPIVAGAAEMPYSNFLFFNILGGLFWVLSMSLIGYFLGATVPDIDRYLLFIIIGIVLISAVPSVIHVLKTPEFQNKIHEFRKKVL